MNTPYVIKAKASGVLFVEFYDADGVRKRVSCATRDPRAAREKARAIVKGNSGSSLQAAEPKAGAITMAMLFDLMMKTDWSPQHVRSQPTVRSNVKILNTYIGTELVGGVNSKRLEALAAELFAAGYSAGTVDRKLNAVGAALGRATIEYDDQGRPWLQGRPRMPKITVDNFRDRVIFKDEEAAIFAAITQRAIQESTRDWHRFHCLIRFLLDTGCRLGEALRLTAKDVDRRDRGDGRVVLYAVFPRYTTKNKKPRQIPLTDAVAQNMDFLAWGAPGGRYFKISAATAWNMWKAIRADVKAKGFDIDDVTLHTCRHTCLTRLAQSGKLRIEQIADWAGHSSVEITRQRYLHLLPRDQLPVLDVLNDFAEAAA